MCLLPGRVHWEPCTENPAQKTLHKKPCTGNPAQRTLHTPTRDCWQTSPSTTAIPHSTHTARAASSSHTPPQTPPSNLPLHPLYIHAAACPLRGTGWLPGSSSGSHEGGTSLSTVTTPRSAHRSPPIPLAASPPKSSTRWSRRSSAWPYRGLGREGPLVRTSLHVDLSWEGVRGSHGMAMRSNHGRSRDMGYINGVVGCSTLKKNASQPMRCMAPCVSGDATASWHRWACAHNHEHTYDAMSKIHKSSRRRSAGSSPPNRSRRRPGRATMEAKSRGHGPGEAPGGTC